VIEMPWWAGMPGPVRDGVFAAAAALIGLGAIFWRLQAGVLQAQHLQPGAYLILTPAQVRKPPGGRR
jgi:hypothetical protein